MQTIFRFITFLSLCRWLFTKFEFGKNYYVAQQNIMITNVELKETTSSFFEYCILYGRRKCMPPVKTIHTDTSLQTLYYHTQKDVNFCKHQRRKESKY